MPHVIQLMFDTKSGCVARRLYVSQITIECDGHRISPQATQAQGVKLCSIEPGEIEIPRNVRKITTAVTACELRPTPCPRFGARTRENPIGWESLMAKVDDAPFRLIPDLPKSYQCPAGGFTSGELDL
jgi:hypothetical protein